MKVIRGLDQVRRALPNDIEFGKASDAGSALLWMREISAWSTRPRRKGKVPPQLVRALRRRR
jgi:hypothetical protein